MKLRKDSKIYSWELVPENEEQDDRKDEPEQDSTCELTWDNFDSYISAYLSNIFKAYGTIMIY